MPSNSQEILERLNVAASQRGLAGPTLTAYRRIWRETVLRVAKGDPWLASRNSPISFFRSPRSVPGMKL